MINAVGMADNDLNVEGLPMFGLVSVGVTSLHPLPFIYCYKIVLMLFSTGCVKPKTNNMSSKITQKIIADLVASDEKGLKEYGVTVDREDYTLRDWLQEAYEETCDTAKYLRAAIDKIDRDKKS